MAQAKPACGSHPHDCNADVLSIQYNTLSDSATNASKLISLTGARRRGVYVSGWLAA